MMLWANKLFNVFKQPFKLALIVLILALAWAQLTLWFGEHGIYAVRQLEQQIAQQEAKIESLKARNDKLESEVTILKQDPKAIEAYAREKLHLIKPGETLVHFDEPNLVPKKSHSQNVPKQND